MNNSEIQEWLVAHIAELLQVSASELDVQAPLANYGLSSQDALALFGDLEELLGHRISPTLAYEYPSVIMLARYLGGHKDDQAELKRRGHLPPNSSDRGQWSHPLLGVMMKHASSSSSFLWQTEIDPGVLTYLSDHKIDDSIIFPAAAYLEMAMQACREAGVGVEYEIGEFLLARKMLLEKGITRQVKTSLTFEEGVGGKISINSRQSPEDKWELHGYARILKAEPALGPNKDPFSEKGSFSNAASFYKTLDNRGLNYGPAFRGVEKVWDNECESLGKIRLPDMLQYEADDYLVHPALLDACLQASGAIKGATTMDDLYIPAIFKRIRFFAKPGREVWSHALLHRPGEEGKLLVDIRITDDEGQPVVELQGFQMHRIRRSNVREILNRRIWLYDQQWKEDPGSAIAALSSSEKKQWLIFNDHNGLGSMLAAQLEAGGHHCYVLPFDSAIHSTEDQLRNIIESQLNAIQGPLYGIVYLWGLSPAVLLSEETKKAGRSQMPGSNSVLLIVQALVRKFATMPKLWLVTRGAYVLEEDESVDIGQSTLWGVGKVISFGFPELRCTRIDLSNNCTDLEVCSDLFKGLMMDDQEDQIAIRLGNKSVPRLLPSTPTQDDNSSVIHNDGTYLITGGLGALGIVTAKWMVDRSARHLVLMDSSKPSPSAAQVIEEMRADGVEVVIELADVSNAMEVEQAFRRMEENMPELRGLVHIAGMLDDGSLVNLDMGRMNNVMASKVNGTWNLHLATINKSLDFFVMFSSVSVLGSPGKGKYAAASSFLDAMAHYRCSLGLPALTINWGPWAEIGLVTQATEHFEEQHVSAEHLPKVIHIEDGMKVLELLIAGSAPQVFVLPFDLANV